MINCNKWLHYTPSILKQGTTKHADPKPLEGQEDMEPEDLMKIEVAKDPWEPRLKPITDDDKTNGSQPGWVIRSYNINTD
jgi:hypothetical protein